MKVTTKRLENCQMELTIEVEPERVEEAMREAARKISQQTNIPGFRRGKAPYHIVVQTFGRQTVLEEALEDLGPKVYSQALDDADVDPYGSGKLVDIQWEPMVLTFHVPMPPEVDLGDYHRLRLDVPPVDVADEEVEEELGKLQDAHAAWVPVEREARKGDQVIFRYDLAGEEEQKSDVVVLGEETGYVPGLVEALEGMRAGESRTVEITFPEDWEKEGLAGQTRPVTLTLEEVKEKELPALEELPALVGDYPDPESLKAYLREELWKKKEAERDAQLVDKALAILMEQATISYPDFLVEEEIDEILESHDGALRRQGFTLDDYLRVMRIEREAYRQQQKEEAVQRVRRALLLGRLAELEKLAVDEGEIQAEADSQAQASRDPEVMRQFYQMPEVQRYLRNQLLVEKVHQRVLEIVTGRVPELPAEEPRGEASEGTPAVEA